MTAWTPIPKPTESSVTSTSMSGGDPIGLLLALTQTTFTSSSSVITGWTGTAKPTVASWISVAPPTSSVWTAVAKPTT